MFGDHGHYNVYDMTNDEWLFDHKPHKENSLESKACCDIKFDTYHDSVKSLFLNDEMIITSEKNYLSFYYIPTKDLKSLDMICRYRLKTENLNYSYHGMCCIGLKHSIDKKIQMNNFSMKILLLGGETNDNFFQSFLIVEIFISMPFYQTKAPSFGEKNSYDHICDNSYDYYSINYNVGIDVTKETLVDETKLRYNINDNNNNDNNENGDKKTLLYENFGCICLRNTLKTSEPIVLLIGGTGSFINPRGDDYDYDTDESDYMDAFNPNTLFIYNVAKEQLKKVENVCVMVSL